MWGQGTLRRKACCWLRISSYWNKSPGDLSQEVFPASHCPWSGLHLDTSRPTPQNTTTILQKHCLLTLAPPISSALWIFPSHSCCWGTAAKKRLQAVCTYNVLNHITAPAVLLEAIAMVPYLFCFSSVTILMMIITMTIIKTAHPLDTLTLPPVIKNTKKQIPFSKHKTPYTVTRCLKRTGFINDR